MANPPQPQKSARFALGLRGVLSILGRYFREKATEQVKSVWFIIVYLILFQVVVLRLPIIYSLSIALGLLIVVVGLTFFMEGLRLGLMPFGETIGAILPRNSRVPMIMIFAFLLGVGATFAEPAISVLKQAGSGVAAGEAPLLYSLLNDFSGQLVGAVGIGVGVAVMLGILRFFYGWSLKVLIVPLVLMLCGMTLYAYFDPVLAPVIGLAWDCGAVTTGPVTVPLVLALGIGVCRIVGAEDAGRSGFGIVTLASLFPILAVLLLAFGHAAAGDYYGAPNYAGAKLAPDVPDAAVAAPPVDASPAAPTLHFTKEDLEDYKRNRTLPKRLGSPRVTYRDGDVTLEDGRIVHRNVAIVFEKRDEAGLIESFVKRQTRLPWNPKVHIARALVDAALMAVQAIIPLCGFLLLTLVIVLKERLRKSDEIAVGIIFSVVGMALFGLGLTLGLTPLGTQLGANIPVTFAPVVPWGLSGTVPPLFDNVAIGKLITIVFAFFLGYGATLAEPALNALGQTVEDITVGVFRKKLLMQVVAFGVGLGIAAGVAQMEFEALDLTVLLIPAYLLLIALTLISSEEFVNFAWDSAGVTTGPITVPLVLAVGLGIGGSIPGLIDGFGILALASVGPIITVLSVGLLVNRSRRLAQNVEGEDAV